MVIVVFELPPGPQIQGDLLTWQLLCSAAQFAAGADANSWSFRSWAHRLKPLGGGTWSWDLDQRRVRATAEIFRFDRGAQEPQQHEATEFTMLLVVQKMVSPTI